VVHDVLRVDLVVKIAGAEKHVNQQLIDMGFADQVEESHLSHVSCNLPHSQCYLLTATGCMFVSPHSIVMTKGLYFTSAVFSFFLSFFFLFSFFSTPNL